MMGMNSSTSGGVGGASKPMSISIPSISKASAIATRECLSDLLGESSSSSSSSSASSGSSFFLPPRPRVGLAAAFVFFVVFFVAFCRSLASLASLISIASCTKSRFISTMAKYSLFDAQELMIFIPGGGGGVAASPGTGLATSVATFGAGVDLSSSASPISVSASSLSLSSSPSSSLSSSSSINSSACGSGFSLARSHALAQNVAISAATIAHRTFLRFTSASSALTGAPSQDAARCDTCLDVSCFQSRSLAKSRANHVISVNTYSQ
mmetsp:Transcript_3856/g.13943  ORF Transcript_3856/g.13943 Transcript_3856/m.13943 type:complete len:267 (+) Transcript_3856:1357-2157(+)